MWTQQRASLDSAELSFEDVHQMPTPTAGTVPVWVSSTVNRRSMAPLARFGSGWIPWGPDGLDIVSGIAKMREAVASAGRDPAGIEVTGRLQLERDSAGDPQIGAHDGLPVPGLIEAGVTDFSIGLQPPAGVEARPSTSRPGWRRSTR